MQRQICRHLQFADTFADTGVSRWNSIRVLWNSLTSAVWEASQPQFVCRLKRHRFQRVSGRPCLPCATVSSSYLTLKLRLID